MFREPVPFVDVLRAAATEVEDYTRVKVITRTDDSLAGAAVADVIHMLAELVENATIFSPSDTEVVIVGGLVARGFAIDIEDRGPGMSGEELAGLNASLANPPLFDLSGSDRLGIFVAGRLAQRHGIEVTLRQSPYGGVNAIVLIPTDLVVPATEIDQGAVPGGYATTGRHALAAQPGNGTGPRADLSAATGIGPRADLSTATGTGNGAGNGAWAWAGATAEPLSEPDTAELPEPAAPGPPNEFDSVRAPIRLAEDGMPRRVRQASLAPQLRRTTATSPEESAMPDSHSPERAGTVLSAFRRGWQQGISEPDIGQDNGAISPDDSRSQ